MCFSFGKVSTWATFPRLGSTQQVWVFLSPLSVWEAAAPLVRWVTHQAAAENNAVLLPPCGCCKYKVQFQNHSFPQNHLITVKQNLAFAPYLPPSVADLANAFVAEWELGSKILWKTRRGEPFVAAYVCSLCWNEMFNNHIWVWCLYVRIVCLSVHTLLAMRFILQILVQLYSYCGNDLLLPVQK